MIRVVSLFCGLGGWDLGLYQAAADLGIEMQVVAAFDHWPIAVKCYNANLPHPVAEVADLKTVRDLPPHDLVIGGPPCQDHSLAGGDGGGRIACDPHLDCERERLGRMTHETKSLEATVRKTVKVGDRIFFEDGGKRPFTVRAISSDRRYLICTKPFNPRRTVLYCIVDFRKGWRGPDNMVFGLGYETQEQIDARMAELEADEMEVSHRRYLPLDIVRIES